MNPITALRPATLLLLALFASTFATTILAAPATEWRPITSDELASKASTIDPDADSEILYRHERVDDSRNNKAYIKTYIRLKIYSEKGLQRFGKIDIPFTRDMEISTLEARVIKPDGTIIPVEKNAFFTRDLFRAGKERVQVRSFAPPNLEVGAIIEYSATFNTRGNLYVLQLRFQREIPTRYVEIQARPHITDYLHTDIRTKGRYPERIAQPEAGFLGYSMTDLPALKEEPFMPPENEIQALVSFFPRPVITPGQSFWEWAGGHLNSHNQELLKPTRTSTALCKKIAADCTANLPAATSAEERLRALYNHTRCTIRNVESDALQFTADEITKIKTNNSLADIAANRYGTTADITTYFVAIARAAGYDARIAFCNDRSDRYFDRRSTDFMALSGILAAVKIVDQW